MNASQLMRAAHISLLSPGLALAASHPVDATSMSSGSLVQTSLSLLVVLLLIFAIAWLARRYLPQQSGHTSAIKIVSSLQVGHRERVILLEIGEQWVMIGVAPGQINTLTTMPRLAVATDAMQPSRGFSRIFAAHLTRTQQSSHETK